jgi:hypothetical protein
LLLNPDSSAMWRAHPRRRHLQKFIIEFYKRGTTVALGRWDFPIRYDGNGVDEMWVDRQFLQQSFDEPPRPPDLR